MDTIFVYPNIDTTHLAIEQTASRAIEIVPGYEYARKGLEHS